MKDQINTNVKAYIASFAGMKAQNVKDEHVLQDHPLRYDDAKLGSLAIALRAYLKSLNPEETVLVTELRESGLDVRGTCDLIVKKAGV